MRPDPRKSLLVVSMTIAGEPGTMEWQGKVAEAASLPFEGKPLNTAWVVASFYFPVPGHGEDHPPADTVKALDLIQKILSRAGCWKNSSALISADAVIYHATEASAPETVIEVFSDVLEGPDVE